jgi:hypothetical protein
MLDMKATCETCDAVLGDTAEARICSFECTFCVSCADATSSVCPNCGGELAARPKRAAAG